MIVVSSASGEPPAAGRALLLAGVVLVALGVLVVLAGDEPRGSEPFVIPPHHEKRLLELERAAIEDAYQRQVRMLFLNWMKDEAGQPERAARGVLQARRAYVDSMRSIEAREERQ